MKKVLPAAFFFLILLLLFPDICVEGAKSGLLLWFNTIIPTLFPFILITNIVRDLGGIPLLERIFSPLISRLFKTGAGGAYPVVLGFLCGYPMGAKAVADSLSCRRISQKEATYLLSFTNNPSPIYMISYVAIFTLNAPGMKLPVMIIACLTSIITAFIFRCFFYKSPRSSRAPVKPKAWPFSGRLSALSLKAKPSPSIFSKTEGTLNTAPKPPQSFFDRSIISAFELLVKVGGYMILFSILSGCLTQIPWLPPIIACLLCGLLEQTTGLGLLKVQAFSLEIKTVLAMAMICFGGLSITAQTYSVIHSQGLSIKPYLFSKLLSGLIAAALAAVWLSC